jgi:hypothetical protein
LDQWYKYVKENKGDKKDTCFGIGKSLLVSICASKEESTKTISQGFLN